MDPRLTDAVPRPLADRDPLTAWPIRIIGLLLLVQAGTTLGVTLYRLSRLPWPAAGGLRLDALPPDALDVLLLSLTFLPIALLAMLAAAGIFWLRPTGWLLGMLTQGLSLLLCLLLYWERQPGFIYPIMLYNIILVLYLNSYDIRLAFHTMPPPAPPELPRDA